MAAGPSNQRELNTAHSDFDFEPEDGKGSDLKEEEENKAPKPEQTEALMLLMQKPQQRGAAAAAEEAKWSYFHEGMTPHLKAVKPNKSGVQWIAYTTPRKTFTSAKDAALHVDEETRKKNKPGQYYNFPLDGSNEPHNFIMLPPNLDVDAVRRDPYRTRSALPSDDASGDELRSFHLSLMVHWKLELLVDKTYPYPPGTAEGVWRPPIFEGYALNLASLYRLVCSLGGVIGVEKNDLWVHVARVMVNKAVPGVKEVDGKTAHIRGHYIWWLASFEASYFNPARKENKEMIEGALAAATAQAKADKVSRRKKTSAAKRAAAGSGGKAPAAPKAKKASLGTGQGSGGGGSGGGC